MTYFSTSFSTTTTDTTAVASTDAYNGDVEYYIAAYPYESAEAGDLTFSAGEMVMVIKKEGDWWTGTIGNRTGMFPSNYVQKADVGGGTAAATITDTTEEYEDTYKVSEHIMQKKKENALAALVSIRALHSRMILKA